MTDQKPITQDDLREIADVLETDSHYSGSDESKRRAGYAAKLREHAAAMDAAKPVAWIDSLSLDWLAQERAKNNRNAGAPVYAIQPIRTLPLYTHPAPPASEVVEAWQPIETAPKGKGLLLHTYYGLTYCGRQRYGTLGEPQQDVFAWRCDSSGRFGNPTHWMPLPAPPANLTGANNG